MFCIEIEDASIDLKNMKNAFHRFKNKWGRFCRDFLITIKNYKNSRQNLPQFLKLKNKLKVI